MRALVVGGAGFIGSRLAPALERLDCEAVTVARTGGALRADRRDPSAIAALIGRERCDIVIDMIAYDAASTAALHAAIAGSVNRIVVASSADVYRAYGGLLRLEDGDPTADLLTEDAPLRQSRYPYRRAERRPEAAADAWMDDYDKILVEEVVAGPRTTIVRLPMVYGPGDRQARFSWIVKPMVDGAAAVRAPRAWLDLVTTYGFVADVAHAIALCATHPDAAGKTFHCGETPVSHTAWIPRFAALHGWRGEVIADDAAPIAAVTAGLDLRYRLALDTGRIRRELGFQEMVAPEEAARLTARAT